MKSNPLVSVVIPNYNHAKFLRQRIDSVINQTYTNFEIILLDDCSNDESLNVIKDYIDHPKIVKTVINDENSGSTFKQWDKGIRFANGDLLWIAESDDYADTHFLERLVSCYQQKDIVIAFCSSNYVYENGEIQIVSPSSGDTFISSSDFIKRYLLFGCLGNISAVLFDLSIAKHIPLDYTTYKAAGDHLFTIQVAQRGSVAFVGDSLNFCRIHSDSVTPNAIRKGLTFIEERRTYNYLLSNNYIKGWDWININFRYLEWILSIKFDSITTNCRIVLMWNPFPLIPARWSLWILRRLRSFNMKR